MPQIVINNSNATSDPSNAVFTLKFNSTQTFNRAKIGLQSFSTYYSWFNITSKLNNNSFTYTWVDNTVNTVSLADGFYSVADINNALINAMVLNTHFLINSQGSNVYYLLVAVNSVRYAIEITSNPVPVTLPSGWSMPSGATWSLPSPAATPQLTVPSSNNFGSLIGFSAATYPASQQATIYSIVSNSPPPVITPVSNVFITLDILQSSLMIGNGVMAQINASQASSFGGLISINSLFPVYQDIAKTATSSITMRLVNAENNQLVQLVDNSATCAVFNIILEDDPLYKNF